jgi:hypothetical protein
MSRMKPAVWAGLCAVLLVIAPSQVTAQQGPGTMSVTIKLAVDPSIGGVMHLGASGDVNGDQLTVQEQSWSDTHSQKSPLFVGGVGFGLAETAEIVANFEYGRVGSDTVEIGTLDGQPLYAAFDRYQFWGVEGGFRLGRDAGAYALLTGGFRRVSAINAILSTGSNQYRSTEFYAASVVPSFGAGGGVLFGDSSLAVGLEVLFKYAGKPKSVPLGLDDTSLDAINTRGERWSLPISLVFRF